MSNSANLKRPYERIYGKHLSPEKIAEMKFNLTGFFKTLIEMDKQYEDWKRQQNHKRVKE